MSINKAPKLRFSEFNSHWKTKNLKDITKINQGLQIPISDRFTEKVPGSYFYITNEFLKEDSGKKYFIKNPNKSVLCDEDDILMTRTGNTGEVVTGVSGAFHNNFFKIKYSEDCNKEFLYYFLTSHRTQHTILKLAGTSTIPDLNHGDFYGIEIVIPEKKEQQKIASFLSSVDQKIQQLRRKKELLEEYKKGVMQKLFSQEIRFKDENGEEFTDWEEYNVDKFLKLFVTNSFSRNDLTYESGEVKNIHYGDIHSEFKMGFKVNEETVPYIVEEKKLSKYDEEQYLKPGDLLIADASEDYADIGKAIEVIETKDEKILAGLHIIHARDKEPLTVVGFKGYLFRSEEVRKQLKRISQGASVLGISKSNFTEVTVKLPCKSEQQKIVEFLQNIDKNITLVESKIEKFQTFKKGLLQQMFV
jgi:type I restriction enzyme S subunit